MVRPSASRTAPGVAVGIDLAAPHGAVAVAVGGNAETLEARDGEPGPATASLRDPAGRFDPAATAAALLALRGRAERALGRPVTHAAIVVSEPLDASVRNALRRSGVGERAGDDARAPSR